MIITNKITTQFDIPELMDIYSHHQNYEIMYFNKDDDRCIIYFSGNGLYYPNDSETFCQNIIKNNRFEWKKNIVRTANKVIFLRDVTKQWYITGINAEINTIDKLVLFLKEQTRGLKVICIGNSAGGYAATLFGCLLNATHIFNFSGQFNLLDGLQTEQGRALSPTLVKYETTKGYRDYLSIVKYLETSHTHIFYFYPALVDEDIAQSKHIESVDIVHQFKFNTKIHGTTCYPCNFIDVFSLSLEKLLLLHSCYKNRLISPLSFSIKTSGFIKSLSYISKKLLKRFSVISFF
jgi:hypothetical protein